MPNNITILYSRISNNIWYLMLFSPLLSYITFGILGLENSINYFILITFTYGLIFVNIKGKYLKFPRMLYWLLLYSIYLTIWSFYNGGIERRGLFQIIINKDIISLILTIVIINNTQFSELFIKKSIIIIKLTVIITAIVSIIQVVNYKFMNAIPLWSKGNFADLMNGDLYTDRRISIFGYISPNEFGFSFIPLLSILIGMLLSNKYRYYYIFLIIGGMSSFLTNTRYVMIAYIIITLQVFFRQKQKFIGIIKFIFYFWTIGVIIIQFLSLVGYDILDWYNSRLLAEGSLHETTRYKAIENFLTFFPRSPFVGTGVHLTPEIEAASNAVGSSQIHVGYLSHLVSYGIIGSILLFGFWIHLARNLFITAKNTKYWGSFFAFLTFLWANITLVHYSIFHYGLIFALIFDKYQMDNKKI